MDTITGWNFVTWPREKYLLGLSLLNFVPVRELLNKGLCINFDCLK